MGPSSGAAIHAAIELAKTDEAAGKTIVVLQASSGIRYVNHPMWDPEREEAALALPRTITRRRGPMERSFMGSKIRALAGLAHESVRKEGGWALERGRGAMTSPTSTIPPVAGPPLGWSLYDD